MFKLCFKVTSLKKTAEGRGGYFPKCSNSERTSISHAMEGHRPAFASFILNTVRGLTAFKKFSSSSLALQCGCSQEQGRASQMKSPILMVCEEMKTQR